MKKWIIIFILVLIAVAVGFGVVHYKSGKKPLPPTITATKGNISEKAQAIGYIEPKHSSTVKSPVNGTVMALYHDSGDFVTKGTVLAKIKPEPEPAEYAAAYEAVQEAAAQEKAALKDIRRYSAALKSGLVSKNYTDYINAKKNYATYKAKRLLAEQKLALLIKGSTKVANKILANTVKSPITGFILYRNVDVGDPVISLSSAQAATTLFTMANMDDLMFSGSVDEMDAAAIKNGMQGVITIGAYPEKTISGILTKIALQSEQENQKSGATVDSDLPFNVSFKVEITKLKIPHSIKLRSGFSATASIRTKEAKNVVLIPERVLHFSNGKKYVLLPSGKKQPVTIGLSDGMNVQIVKGLSVGAKVLDKPSDVSS